MTAGTGFGVETPILMIVFNRPFMTSRLVQRLAEVRPRRLFVQADGPRDRIAGELERCQAVRAVVDAIDWPCDIQRRYLDGNVGCSLSVTGGLAWFFGQVDEGIVLEDDIVPHPSFFRWCAELLERYRHDERIDSVAGFNFGYYPRARAERWPSGPSYRFSRFMSMWGWATWRRAFEEVDFEMSRFLAEEDKLAYVRNLLAHPASPPDEKWRRYWARIFSEARSGTWWDWAWVLSSLERRSLSVSPAVSLTENRGFGPSATNTTSSVHAASRVRSRGIRFPLIHPELVTPDLDYEDHLKRCWCDLYPTRRRKVYRKLRMNRLAAGLEQRIGLAAERLKDRWVR